MGKLRGLLEWWQAWNAQRVQDRMIVDQPPLPVIVMGTQGSGGEMVLGASATEGPRMGDTVSQTTSLTTISGRTAAIIAASLRSAAPKYGEETQAVAGVDDYMCQRIGQLGDMTLAGGVLNNHQLVPAVAGYYACIKVTSIWSDTADTYSMAFQDETDVALTGMPATADWLIANPDEAIPMYGMTGFAAADNRAIEVDIAGGGGVEALYLQYVYWYET